ncbi:MAG: family transcriptional regulator [Bacilli bacterium]|nr:family transcriptional regulator [Bacilli bacterium]
MKPTVDIDFIRSFMKVKGLGESEFSHAIGVSHSLLNRVLNGKRNAGNKVIFGMLSTFKELRVEQFCSYDQQLTKGNKNKKSA